MCAGAVSAAAPCSTDVNNTDATIGLSFGPAGSLKCAHASQMDRSTTHRFDTNSPANEAANPQTFWLRYMHASGRRPNESGAANTRPRPFGYRLYISQIQKVAS